MIRVEKNFLQHKDFLKINDLIENDLFNFYFYNLNNIICFYHLFYRDDKIASPYIKYIEPLKQAIGKDFISANLVIVPQTKEKIKYFFSEKSNEIKIKNSMSALYFLNTNNGELNIKSFDKIKPMENSICIFDSNLDIEDFSCTDATHKSCILLEFYK